MYKLARFRQSGHSGLSHWIGLRPGHMACAHLEP